MAGQNCTGSGTGSEGARTISRDLRVCIDLGNEASAAASAAGTIAGVLAAALDVRAHNCRAVAGCGSLLPEDVDLSVKYVYNGGTALGAAKAAVSCSDSGGRVYVTYPDSQTRVLVPYNSAKGVLTAAFQPVFSQDSLDIEPFLR